MAELIVAYDPSKPLGQRLAPEVRAEIAMLSPWGIPKLSVGEDNIVGGAVTDDKIKDEAVTDTKIAPTAVNTQHIADAAVKENQIAAAVLTNLHVAYGIATAEDGASGAASSLALRPMTAIQHAALEVYNNDTLYIIHAADGAPG